MGSFVGVIQTFLLKEGINVCKGQALASAPTGTRTVMPEGSMLVLFWNGNDFMPAKKHQVKTAHDHGQRVAQIMLTVVTFATPIVIYSTAIMRDKQTHIQRDGQRQRVGRTC